jgi:hypothetical protein
MFLVFFLSVILAQLQSRLVMHSIFRLTTYLTIDMLQRTADWNFVRLEPRHRIHHISCNWRLLIIRIQAALSIGITCANKLSSYQTPQSVGLEESVGYPRLLDFSSCC